MFYKYKTDGKSPEETNELTNSLADTLQDNVPETTEGSEPDCQSLSESKCVFIPQYSSEEVDQELCAIMESMTILGPDSVTEAEDLCFVCREIVSVGPAPIRNGMEWPPIQAPVLYKSK
jgi:hypothetical protein